MRKLLALVPLTLLAFTGCATAETVSNVEPVAHVKTVEADYDSDGVIDLLVTEVDGCPSLVELVDVHGVKTGDSMDFTGTCVNLTDAQDMFIEHLETYAGL